MKYSDELISLIDEACQRYEDDLSRCCRRLVRRGSLCLGEHLQELGCDSAFKLWQKEVSAEQGNQITFHSVKKSRVMNRGFEKNSAKQF